LATQVAVLFGGRLKSLRWPNNTIKLLWSSWL
jgi:hypothetical protein